MKSFTQRLTIMVCVFSLASCDFMTPSMTINYKVTVEIETPEGIKSGYAVRQISNRVPLVQFPDVGNPASIRGEAVVVDLGERGKVFYLLPQQSWQNGLYQAFPTKGASTKEGIEYYKKLKIGDKAEWLKTPISFVYFSNLEDPTSLKAFNYGQIGDVLEEGYKVKSITVEITDEPITNRIEPFIKRFGYRSGMFDRTRFQRREREK
ncbi:MAG: hypothetical protein OEY94_10795 [Alphaproteobacteria bacterium]|nr:hypothetical protein [Alphaproteobacteria bacterium]